MPTLDSGWLEFILCAILSNDEKRVKRLAAHFSKLNAVSGDAASATRMALMSALDSVWLRF